MPSAPKKYRVTYCARTSPLPLLPSGPGGIGGITSRRTRHLWILTSVTSASSVVRPLSKQRASERPINQLINLNCCRIFSPMPHYCSAQLISFLQLSALLAWLIAAIVNETGSWNARRRIRTLTPQERRQKWCGRPFLHWFFRVLLALIASSVAAFKFRIGKFNSSVWDAVFILWGIYAFVFLYSLRSI